MKTLVDVDSYMYRVLKSKFPEHETFYSWYEDGDYYNRAETHYYDAEGVEIYSEQHSNYG